MAAFALNQTRALDLGNESVFNKPRQITYWKRCLKTYLPTLYQSNDLNRMLLAFFIVSALDLLGVLDESAKPEELEGYREWIYSCQHPDGGFRGSPGTDLSDRRTEENAHWDPANLPATYLAIGALLILRDDLTRLKRRECLIWLNKLQRPDGSFGETLGENDSIEGGLDTRFGYSAAVVRWMLRDGATGPVLGVPDIDVNALIACIRAAQSYDGGISESPFHESHAGLTYCALAALFFLDALPTKSNPHPDPQGLSDPNLTIHWLVSRQTATLDEDDAFDTLGDETDTPETCHDAHSMVKLPHSPTSNGAESLKSAPTSRFHRDWAGFNGRCNKIADTCYAWWVGGSLAILGQFDLVDQSAVRRYLLDKTQHLVGGFGKGVGDPPDIYHSYLGLTVLAMVGRQEDGVQPLFPPLCLSRGAWLHLEGLQWRLETSAGAVVDRPWENEADRREVDEVLRRQRVGREGPVEKTEDVRVMYGQGG